MNSLDTKSLLAQEHSLYRKEAIHHKLVYIIGLDKLVYIATYHLPLQYSCFLLT